MPDPITFSDIPFNASFPEEMKALVAEWDGVWMSPYSLSLYNTGDKGWDYTPEGSLRVSDHWNFKDSEGRLHCPTRGQPHRRGHWALARYEDGAYVILKQYRMANPRNERKARRKAKGII